MEKGRISYTCYKLYDEIDVDEVSRLDSIDEGRVRGRGEGGSNVNDTASTHQDPPTPQTPLNEIARIAPTREQPQFVKSGESGFVFRLRLSYICSRSFCC